jgi:hypothetical protein
MRRILVCIGELQQLLNILFTIKLYNKINTLLGRQCVRKKSEKIRHLKMILQQEKLLKPNTGVTFLNMGNVPDTTLSSEEER